MNEPGMRVGRLVQIIAARGIRGVVFPVYQRFDISFISPVWSEFANVSFNDHRAAQWFDVVCPDYYHNMDLVLRELARQHVRRVGLVLDAPFDASTHGLAHSSFLR